MREDEKVYERRKMKRYMREDKNKNEERIINKIILTILVVYSRFNII